MALAPVAPQLSRGNHIYLYQLLKKELGCGKQTFLPRVEEALATDELSAELMGFSSTRELLEALDDFVTLTVFKGGRVYATIMSQPDWDAAAKPAGKAGTGAKSWKRKKSGKDVRPVRPTCVKPIEPEPEPEPESQPEPETTPENQTTFEPKAAFEPKPEHETKPEPALETEPEGESEPEPLSEAAAELQPEIESDQEEGLEVAAEPKAAQEHNAPAAQLVPEPTISLTVTYDPSSAHKPGDQEDENPKEPVENRIDHEAPLQQEHATPTPPHPFTPAELDGYPLDLSREVFCPGDILSELAQLLPLGADVLGIANEYYYIAGEQGTLEAGRARAAFPLRFTRDGERHEVMIRMKRRPNGHLGATWTIYAIETMQ